MSTSQVPLNHQLLVLPPEPSKSILCWAVSFKVHSPHCHPALFSCWMLFWILWASSLLLGREQMHGWRIGNLGSLSQAVWLGQSLGSWKMWAQVQYDESSRELRFLFYLWNNPRTKMWSIQVPDLNLTFPCWQVIHVISLASLFSCFCFSYPLALCCIFFFTGSCEGSLGEREAHLGFYNRQDPLVVKPRLSLPSTSIQSLLSKTKTCFLEIIFSYVCVQSTFKGFRERNVRLLLR